ncbi:hypothetical protein [Nonomuraea sp. LPB2021202275-12-8]|uniref:hypothetical protein n=1 Tax=Nonomuraea sp. LPB2021202275-12-8 TaxID=3120159 RepID=UPI00300D851A
MENLDRGLREAREDVRRFDRLAGRRSAVAAQLREVSELIGRLEEQLAKERHDVARLEGGFAGFMAGLVGSKQERLTKERAEAEAAYERLDGQRGRLEELTGDLDRTDRELAETAGAHEVYRRLLADKERLLVELGDDRGPRLVELSTLLADTQADLREHEEASQAGATAGQAVGQMLSLLSSARGASTWDMLGGGAFADAVERQHLMAADQTAWHAQRALDVFSRELADLGWTVNPQLPEVDTRWFADVFFDNIITDALKHQRINGTRDAVAAMSHWIAETVQSLARRTTELRQRHAELLQERERLIAG